MLTDTRTWPEDSQELSPDQLAAARSGDARAFRDLFDALAPMAWRLALVVTGETSGAADAVAIGAGRALGTTSASSAQIPDSIVAMLRATWLAALDVLHRDRRRNESPTNEGAEASEPPVTAETNLEAALVSFAFLTLPEQWRGALWLTEAEGLPAEVAGAVLDLVPEAFSQLLDQARSGFVESGPRVDVGGSSRRAQVGDVSTLLRPALGNLPPDLDSAAAERWQAALVSRSGWHRIMRSGSDRPTGEVPAVRKGADPVEEAAASVAEESVVSNGAALRRLEEMLAAQAALAAKEAAAKEAAAKEAAAKEAAAKEAAAKEEAAAAGSDADPVGLAEPPGREAPAQPDRIVRPPRPARPASPAGDPVAAARRPVSPPLARPVPPVRSAPAPSFGAPIILPPRPARPETANKLARPTSVPPVVPPGPSSVSPAPVVLPPCPARSRLGQVAPVAAAGPGRFVEPEAPTQAMMSGVPDEPEWEFDDSQDDSADRRVAFLPLTHVAVSVAARRTAIGAAAALLCAGIVAGVVISQEGSGSGSHGSTTAPTKPVVTKPAPAVTPPTAAPRSHAKSAAKPVATHHAKAVKVTHQAVSTPTPRVAAPQVPSAPSPTSAPSSSPPSHAPAKTATSGSLTTTHKATVTNHSVAPVAPAKPKASTQTTTSTTIQPTTVATTNNCPGLGIGPICL